MAAWMLLVLLALYGDASAAPQATVDHVAPPDIEALRDAAHDASNFVEALSPDGQEQAAFERPDEARLLDEALDEILESVSEEEMVEMLLHETDETVRAAMERRLRRSAYNCGGVNESPFCQYLRKHLGRPDSRFGGSSGGSSGSFASSGSSASSSSSAGSGSSGFSSSDSSGSSQSSSFSSSVSSSSSSAGSDSGSFVSSGSSSFGAGFAEGGQLDERGSFVPPTPRLEPSCLPPVTHVVRDALEYLPRTVYNTQHLILPSTRVLTMLETELFPQPVYVTVTKNLPLQDLTVTSTVVQHQERTLDVNRARQTELPLRSTKLHIFTDTQDYFWTKTEYVPYYVTQTRYITTDVPNSYSNMETTEVRHTTYITRTVPHVVTHTRTSSTVTRVYVTESAHQYRYVAVTPSAVYVTRTVTAC